VSNPSSEVTQPLRRPRVTGERAEVIASRRVGAYQHLTLVSPAIAELARPGHFVSFAVAGSTSAHLLRRACFLHEATPRGMYGGTIEVVVEPVGVGTRWLAELGPHAVLDVLGPLGRPYPVPAQPVPCVLVAEGRGSAPLLWLARTLRSRGCPVHLILGAPTGELLFGVVDARRAADEMVVATEDGSSGLRAGCADLLPGLLERLLENAPAAVVYASGAVATLRDVARVAAHHGIVCQLALEGSMACTTGLCQACVVPVRAADGREHLVRTCTEGPVLRGDLIRWDALQPDGRWSTMQASADPSPTGRH